MNLSNYYESKKNSVRRKWEITKFKDEKNGSQNFDFKIEILIDFRKNA